MPWVTQNRKELSDKNSDDYKTVQSFPLKKKKQGLEDLQIINDLFWVEYLRQPLLY